jgi:hypothetical protein
LSLAYLPQRNSDELGSVKVAVLRKRSPHARFMAVIESMGPRLEKHDLRGCGFLGLSEAAPQRYTDIRIRFKVRTDTRNPERVKRLTAFSPVFNTITRGANVDIQVEAR